jgi:hypothetical protein
MAATNRESELFEELQSVCSSLDDSSLGSIYSEALSSVNDISDLHNGGKHPEMPMRNDVRVLRVDVYSNAYAFKSY